VPLAWQQQTQPVSPVQQERRASQLVMFPLVEKAWKELLSSRIEPTPKEWLAPHSA